MPLTSAGVLATAGEKVSVNIDRDATAFTFTVNIVANNAQSVEAHQAMTTEEGWVNVNSVSKSATATSAAPTCNVEIESFEFGSYSE